MSLLAERPSAFEIGPAEPGRQFRVNGFIHASEGFTNSYLVTTDDGSVVIGTGLDFEGPIHRRHFDAVSQAPIRYVILTQAHADVVGGLAAFTARDTDVVAQRNHPECEADKHLLPGFRARRSAFAFGAVVRRGLAQAGRGDSVEAALAGLPRPEPTILFDERFDFELGGRRFELFSTPGGETLDSLVVWLPQERIAFTGNLLGPLFPHVPNLVTLRGDRLRFALPYLAALEELLALEPELLITGHFRPIEGRDVIRKALRDLRDALRHVHDETLRGMNQGKELHALMREIQLPPELEVGEGYGRTSWNVRAIWEGYAGWFHQRSTTELYPIAPTATHADLVELAGAERIAERAQEHLAAGRPLEAIQLAEVVLSQEPAQRAALLVLLRAHEALLAAGARRNFWETCWLEAQIRGASLRLAGAGAP